MALMKTIPWHGHCVKISRIYNNIYIPNYDQIKICINNLFAVIRIVFGVHGLCCNQQHVTCADQWPEQMLTIDGLNIWKIITAKSVCAMRIMQFCMTFCWFFHKFFTENNRKVFQSNSIDDSCAHRLFHKVFFPLFSNIFYPHVIRAALFFLIDLENESPTRWISRFFWNFCVLVDWY